MMVVLSPKLVWRVHGKQPVGPSHFFAFLIAYTKVNAYLEMKYLLKNNDTFMNFISKWLKFTNIILMRILMEVHKRPDK